MCGKDKPMAVLLATLVFCILLFPLFVPEGRVDVVDGTAAQKHCIRQADDTAGSAGCSSFFYAENVRVPSGTGLILAVRTVQLFTDFVCPALFVELAETAVHIRF